MSNKKSLKVVFVVILIALPLRLWAFSVEPPRHPRIGEIKGSPPILELELKSFKHQYLLREPIWVKLKVTNIGEEAGSFYFTSVDGLKIEDSKGDEYPCRIHIDRLPIAINPGEVLQKEFNLLMYYGLPENKYKIHWHLPPEKYSIRYEINQTVRSETYRVEARSETYTFRIIEPKGDDLKAMNLLKEAYDLQVLKKDESYKDKLKELLREYPDSRYYVYALLMSADSLDDWYDLIQRFPDSREAVRAVRSIALTFEKEKDKKGYTEAMNELIEKYPNTDIAREAQKQLENIKEEDFK